MDLTSTLLSLSFLYWDTAVAHTLLILLAGASFGPGSFIPFLPWLGCVVVSFLLLRFVLCKERPFNLVLFLAVALAAGQMAFLLLTFTTDHRFRPLLFAVACLLYPIGRFCQYAFETPLLSRLQTRFEVSILVFGFALMAEASNLWERSWLFPLFSAALLCLLSMILSRVLGADILTDHPRAAVLAILAALALLAGLSGLAWVFLILPYEAGISAFLKALRALGHTIIDLINRFFLFLASILPASEDDLGDIMPPQNGQISVEKLDLPDYDMRWLAVLLVVAAAVLFCLLLYKLRNIRLRAPRLNRKKAALGRSRVSLLKALKAALGRLLRRLRLRAALFRQRKTCQGAFYWLEDKNVRRPLYCRTAGETPEEYLSRLAQDAPAAAPHLAQLSNLLSAQLYGGGPALPFKSRPLKKAWRKHLRPTWQSRFNRVKDLLFKA